MLVTQWELGCIWMKGLLTVQCDVFPTFGVNVFPFLAKSGVVGVSLNPEPLVHWCTLCVSFALCCWVPSWRRCKSDRFYSSTLDIVPKNNKFICLWQFDNLPIQTSSKSQAKGRAHSEQSTSESHLLLLYQTMQFKFYTLAFAYLRICSKDSSVKEFSYILVNLNFFTLTKFSLRREIF